MRFKQGFFLLIIGVLTSCGGSKKLATNDENVAVAKIIANHNEAFPEFKTLAARIQVAYEDDKKSQSITTSLRIEKDKNIWIKASFLGVTLAKILITPNRVSFYETIGRTYFDGDFALVSDFLGTEINFQQAQALLLGQSIFNLKDGVYTSQSQLGNFKLSPKKQDSNFIYSILLHSKNYKVSSETLSQPSDNRLLDVRYGEYQIENGSFYPSTIAINSSEGESKTTIDLNYKKIDLNVDVSFPFDIPEGYEEITLDK